MDEPDLKPVAATEAPELIPAPALAFAIGFVAGRPALIANEPGRFAMLIDEARRRGIYDDLRESLPAALRSAMDVAEVMDRGASWSGSAQAQRASGGRPVRFTMREG